MLKATLFIHLKIVKLGWCLKNQFSYLTPEMTIFKSKPLYIQFRFQFRSCSRTIMMQLVPLLCKHPHFLILCEINFFFKLQPYLLSQFRVLKSKTNPMRSFTYMSNLALSLLLLKSREKSRNISNISIMSHYSLFVIYEGKFEYLS